MIRNVSPPTFLLSHDYQFVIGIDVGVSAKDGSNALGCMIYYKNLLIYAGATRESTVSFAKEA